LFDKKLPWNNAQGRSCCIGAVRHLPSHNSPPIESAAAPRWRNPDRPTPDEISQRWFDFGSQMHNADHNEWCRASYAYQDVCRQAPLKSSNRNTGVRGTLSDAAAARIKPRSDSLFVPCANKSSPRLISSSCSVAHVRTNACFLLLDLMGACLDILIR